MILYDNLSSGNGYKVRLLFALLEVDYTHVAAEGGFDLAPYTAISAWLERCAAQPGYIPITVDPTR